MNENTKNSIDFLKLITDEFDKNNIPYWLECGTLLGAYRNNSLIETDNDLDIGVLDLYIESVKNLVTNLVINESVHKVNYIHNGESVDDKIIKLMYKKNKLSVDCRWMDIYFFRKKENRIESCLFSDDKFSKVQANLHQIEKLETIKLGDYYFKCPNDVSRFLKIRYGEDFMIPQSRCYSLNKEWWEIDDDLGKQYLD